MQSCTVSNFKVLVNGITQNLDAASSNPVGTLDLVYDGTLEAVPYSVEILQEDPNLELVSGGLIPVQGPYVF